MLSECPERSIQPLSYVELSTRYQASGEAIYRKLSGILHGRVWSVVPAFVMAPHGQGHVVAWRGYPLAVHDELGTPVVGAAEMAAHTVYEYFSGPLPGPKPHA